MKRTFCMFLIAVLALCPVAVGQHWPTETRRAVSANALGYWRSQLKFSQKSDQVDMDEVAARLAWVLAGKELPEDAYTHCLRQAENPRPDMVGFLRWKQDVTPAKRTLCMGILSIDQVNRERNNLATRVKELEVQVQRLQQKQ